MILVALDVSYSEYTARAAAVVGEHNLLGEAAGLPAVTAEFTADITDPAPYVPGHFAARELPCLLSVLEKVDVPYDALIVDGYVYIEVNGEARPTLGMQLFFAMGKPVIGVAKTAYHNDDWSVHVVRGQAAKNPLYVTVAGMPIETAVSIIKHAHGKHRIPTLLQEVDALSRGER